MILVIYKFLRYILFGKTIEDQILKKELDIDILKKTIEYNEDYLNSLSDETATHFVCLTKYEIFSRAQNIKKAICQQKISLLKCQSELWRLRNKRNY